MPTPNTPLKKSLEAIKATKARGDELINKKNSSGLTAEEEQELSGLIIERSLDMTKRI